jgi:hypothetical protein
MCTEHEYKNRNDFNRSLAVMKFCSRA